MHWVKLHSDPHTGAEGGHFDSATATAAKLLWSIVTRRKTDHRKALVKSFPVVPPAALHDVLGKSDRDRHLLIGRRPSQNILTKTVYGLKPTLYGAM